MKNIVVFYPENKFITDQLQKLSFVGKTTFIDNKEKFLVRHIKEADIIAVSPEEENKNPRSWLTGILKKSAQVKGLAVSSSDGSFINKDYRLEKGIVVSVISGHSVEVVAEYVMLLLLGGARRIFVNDWRAQKRKYP